MSFALIYGKPFAGIGNAKRGMTRFSSLTKLFHIGESFGDESSGYYEKSCFCRIRIIMRLMGLWKQRRFVSMSGLTG